MGNFQQHITCSTATGIAVGGIAYHFGFPPPVCLVAAGLCSFAGMLPDIDSNTSKSFQECIYLTAGVGSILAASRLRIYGVDTDLIMVLTAIIFLLIRFGLGTFLKNFTSHRGMIHSIPAAVLCGQLVFFVVTGTVAERLIKAAALTIGFLSHLILDEVYSIDSSGSSIRLKKSFGTALKWTNQKKKGQVAVLYAAVLCLACIIGTHPEVLERVDSRIEQMAFEVAVPLSDGETPTEHWQREVRQAAADFLLQYAAPSVPLSSSVPDFDNLDSRSELPAAMQITNEWIRHLPVEHAPIILP